MATFIDLNDFYLGWDAKKMMKHACFHNGGDSGLGVWPHRRPTKGVKWVQVLNSNGAKYFHQCDIVLLILGVWGVSIKQQTREQTP